MSANESRSTRGLSLTDILNILWRRKSLVFVCTFAGVAAGIAYGFLVTPLHRGTATVQPGITSFNADDQPIREWRIKDIELWFRRGDFNPTLAHLMGRDAWRFRPIIMASSIPRGPQSVGGNTITLTTLDPNPEQAVLILETAIEVFNRFAASDTLRSNLGLKRAQIRSQYEKQIARLDHLAASRERIALQIRGAEFDRENARAKLKLVETRLAELEVVRKTLTKTIEAYEAALARGNQDAGQLSEDIVAWQRQSEGLMKSRENLLEGSGTDATTLLLVSQAVGDLIDDLGSIRLGLLEHSARTLGWEDRVQSLQRELAQTESAIAEAKYERDQALPRRILEIDQQISDLELQRDFDLAQDEAGMRQDLNSIRSRLDSLSPLEQMGRATASARPVRPRKPRAIAILGTLALVGSVFLAFTLEYLSRNWKEITGNEPSPS